MTTPIDTKAEILADLWMNYRKDEEFTDFFEYNDLGLPLAYAMSVGIIKNNDTVSSMVEETFLLLLAGLEIEEDEGYESLDELLGGSVF